MVERQKPASLFRLEANPGLRTVYRYIHVYTCIESPDCDFLC